MCKSTYRSPLRANLPLTTDLNLASAGSFGSLQVLTAARMNIESAVGINLATKDLAMLHAQATCLAAFRPFSYVPTTQDKIICILAASISHF